MGYRWGREKNGQYVDGHEQDDVIAYQQTVFLLLWAELLSHTRIFDNGIKTHPTPLRSPYYHLESR